MSRWVACSTIGRDDPQSVLLLVETTSSLYCLWWTAVLSSIDRSGPQGRLSHSSGEKMLRDKNSRPYVGERKEEKVHTRHLLIDTQVPAQSESQHTAGAHRILDARLCWRVLTLTAPISCFSWNYPTACLEFCGTSHWILSYSVFFLCSKTFPWECLRNVTQHVLLKKKNLFFFYMKHVYLTRNECCGGLGQPTYSTGQQQPISQNSGVNGSGYTSWWQS